ncbi:MAG: sugar transferase [Lewinellaceae bacterium]|nr:sugar transferase [Lewinellaceae bacterium]
MNTFPVKRILFVGASFPPGVTQYFGEEGFSLLYTSSAEQAIAFLNEEGPPFRLVLFNLRHDSAGAFMQLRHFMLKQPRLAGIPFVAVSGQPSSRLKALAKRFQALDCLVPLHPDPAIGRRLRNLAGQEAEPQPLPPGRLSPAARWRRPAWKRLFDICGALVLVLLSLPVFAVVALLIKLESRGPVFYVSKRAGQGYKIFDFYKFRSMRIDADQRLANLSRQNEYRRAAAPPEEHPWLPGQQQLLVQDGGYVEEAAFLRKKSEQGAGTFVKIKNDPRVTRVGRFIRATSIDELPQLFNVLRGDMSLVGNRPIPLYEAERLTSDLHIARFFAPAGITGLWQITKKDKNNLSEEERKLLDIEYAASYNFWMDMRILLKTLPAALQHENA